MKKNSLNNNKENKQRVKTPDISTNKKKYNKAKKQTVTITRNNKIPQLTANLQNKTELKTSINSSKRTELKKKKTKFIINKEKKEDIKIKNTVEVKGERPNSASKKLFRNKKLKMEEKKETKKTSVILNKTGDNFYKPKIQYEKNSVTNNNLNHDNIHKKRKKSVDILLNKKNKKLEKTKNDNKLKLSIKTDTTIRKNLNKTPDNKKIKIIKKTNKKENEKDSKKNIEVLNGKKIEDKSKENKIEKEGKIIEEMTKIETKDINDIKENENNKKIIENKTNIENNKKKFEEVKKAFFEEGEKKQDKTKNEKEEKKEENQHLTGVQLLNNSGPIFINEFIEIKNINKLQSSTNNESSIYIENQTQNNNYFNHYSNNNIIINKYNNVKNYNNNLNNIICNLNSKKKVNSIRQYFSFSPLIGLDNLGATCYMNAILQCLCHIEKIVDYFKYNKNLINYVKNDYDNSKLSSSFKLLIEKLWPDNYNNISNNINNSFLSYKPSISYENQNTHYNKKTKKSFPPEDFQKKISQLSSLFRIFEPNDSKDLLNFIIMTLHEELNKAEKINTNNNINIDQTNKQLMFQIYWKEFMESKKSIISDLFYGTNCLVTKCGFCNIQKYNYESYFFLVFPLEEVRIFKNQNKYNINYLNNNNNDNNEVSIYDCFFYNQKINYFNGKNAMYCTDCKQSINSSMRTILSICPEILIIILNRGVGKQFKVKINFFEQLNLENFIEMKQTGCNYRLIGVIIHLGESSMRGHFISFCQDPITYNWYKYDDSNVTDIGNFKSDIIDFGEPYILFYQKIN